MSARATREGPLHVLGVRHHGPGSARSVAEALDRLRPDAVLIEAPADAAPLLAFAADPGLVPPVAMWLWPSEEGEPGAARGVFVPWAAWSPEWVALRWAASRAVPVELADLPVAHRLASPERGGAPVDALAVLAGAAGWSDPERYWEHLVEARGGEGALEVFSAIAEAMAAVRGDAPASGVEARREAWMRRAARKARRGGARVAFVCGAWHAPALLAPGDAAADEALLRGLPRVPISAAWVPWSAARLARESGYGAGVRSPAWYALLAAHPAEPVGPWMARAARALREAGWAVSAAAAGEAACLAGALAALRGVGAPGWDELEDAALAALCEGSAARWARVADAVRVGHEIGAVPPAAPRPPLMVAFEDTARRLRLSWTAPKRTLELDLRRDLDRARSVFLHRLARLGVPWGRPVEVAGRGTFKASFALAWDPAFVGELAEASMWGPTLEAAASARLVSEVASARGAGALADLGALLSAAVDAELAPAVEAALVALGDAGAAVADPLPLLRALPPLVDVVRYGDVRGTPAERVRPVLEGLFARALVALPLGASGLDDAAAAALVEGVRAAHAALVALGEPALLDAWAATLAALAASARHGQITGGAAGCLLLLGRLDEDALGRHLRHALSPGWPPRHGAAWLEGVLGAGAAALLHRDALWAALDAWLSALSEAAFREVLVPLRRAFAALDAPARARLAARLGGASGPPATPVTGSTARGDRVLGGLGALLGGGAA